MATKTKRKPISTKTRFEIFKRDEFTCQYCGSHPPKAILHVDHVIPVVEGGGNEEENLVTACDRCNLGKGPRPLSAAPKCIETNMAEIAEREEQIRGYAEVMQARRDRIENDCWFAVEPFTGIYRDGEDKFPSDWFHSVTRFVKELGVFEVREAMEIATSRYPGSEYSCFKYFCGVCWRKIKDDLP